MKTYLAKALAWGRKYLLAPLPALVIAAVAILLVVLGFKNVKVGGLLAKLFGKPEGKKAVDIANTIPEDRVDKDGKVIPVGAPDSKGITQAVVVPIETGGMFSDPTVVKVTPPGETKPVVVHLPDGVRDQNVDKVVIIKPDVYAVTVKDSSNVTPQHIDDLLAKYGS